VSGFVLHLMRHGPPEGAGRLLGHSDAPPLARGVAACVERAEGLGFEQVISSDLTRASAPAAAIARAHGVGHGVDPRWRELDFGGWDGADPAVIASPRLDAFWDDPEANPPPGGESWSALVARVGRALDGIAAPTLVVTHAGAMRAALTCLFGFTYRQGWALDLPYGAVLSLRIVPGVPRFAQILGLAG
jgi:alpha-ribazole phosphatase